MSDELRRVERDAFHVESRDIQWKLAIVGALAVGGPLAVGVAIDDHLAGLYASLGALNIGLAVAGASLRRRALRGGALLLGLVLVTVLSTALHPSAVASVGATLLVTGIMAFAAAGDRQDALAGFVVAAVFVITNGLPGGPGDAVERALQLGAGGAVALVLFLLVLRDADEPTDRLPLVVAGKQAALAPGHPVRAHALRIALVAGLSTAAYRVLDLSFGYWIPLTAMAVLQPDGHTSRVRALQRTSGTLIGTAVVAIIAQITDEQWVLVALTSCCAFALFALRGRSYQWLVLLLTPTVLLMISTVEGPGEDFVVERILYTAVGIVLAVVAAAIGPSRTPDSADG